MLYKEQPYLAAPDRYENGPAYRRCGKSGILLSAVSLGLWKTSEASARCRKAAR